MSPILNCRRGIRLRCEARSGSGKTTFLNLAAGILKADTGMVRLRGHNLTTMSQAKRDALRAKTLGYVFQSFNLLQGFTALENVMMGTMFGVGGSYTHQKAWACHLLERVGLTEHMNRRPYALDWSTTACGGCTGVGGSPQLVLADEPTGNLTPNGPWHLSN